MKKLFSFFCFLTILFTICTKSVFAQTTITPTPTATTLSLTIGLHGIGTGGDNTNENSAGNTNIKNPTRTVTVFVVDTTNTQVGQFAGQVAFNAQSGLFTGTVTANTLATGNYLLYIKTNGYLVRQVSGVVAITGQTTNTIPSVYLVTGDINNDNKLSALDYNLLVNCYGNKLNTSSCLNPPQQNTTGADLNDDGIVDAVDYNLLLREVSVQKGDTPPGGVTLTPTPTITSLWNIQKAEYLARRVLPDASADDVQKLGNAKSAQEAVNLLFTPASQTEMANYQNGVQQVIQSQATFKSVDQYEYTLYTYRLIHDPNRAQRQLYYLWENIFSVDAPITSKYISYDDVIALHQLLYDNALGNYIDLVNKVQNNYAMAQYLDLTNSKATSPNENFSRELLQLFLMGPYTPLDKNQTTPNYSDQDVSSLAYILTGYVSDTTAHTMTFDNTKHYQQTKLFLGSQYNDPINDISYILQKKKTEISEFLASKLLHFYVTDSPTDQDLIAVSQMIQNNNFDILPTVKQLLASDIMYTYANEERYKTPFELVNAYYSLLFGRNNYNIIPSSGALTDLNFQPFKPGSIFGRDGFNSNILFYSGSILDRWIADTSVLLNNIPSQNIPLVLSNLVPNYQTIQTPDELIIYLQKTMYAGRNLPQSVKDELKTYLTTDNTGKPLTFNLSSTTYLNARLPGLLNFLFVQPEFIQQSGTILATGLPTLSQGGSASTKLVIVRLRGGIDYQGVVANILDPVYVSNRTLMALDTTNSSSLGNGYVLNNAANSLLPLITSKEAFLVSAAGFPNHSRAHDVASKQMETGLNTAGLGILAQLANAVSSADIISFSSTAPIMVKGAPSLQIGGSSLLLYSGSTTPNTEAATRKNDLVQMFTNRQFPQQLSLFYAQAVLLDKLGTDNIAHGGNGSAGYTNQSQFAFLDQLLTQNTGNIFYVYGDGGYDHHIHEDTQLNTELTTLFTNIVNFYNLEKTKQKLAIVVFSEFGRTNKINGNNGTDHGEGGGIFVISNAVHWPTMVGTINPSQDKSNWTTVQVDARDVWSTLFRDIYNIPLQTLFGRTTSLSNYSVAIP